MLEKKYKCSFFRRSLAFFQLSFVRGFLIY